MKLRLSCDDGGFEDVRVAELATKYDLDCTFYWPVEWAVFARLKGFKPLSKAEAKQIASEFEVGSHTISHRYLTKIPYDEAVDEIVKSKDLLSNMFDQNITSFAPPRGYTNKKLTKLTLEHYDNQRLTRGTHEGYKLVHVHPDSGANENRAWREVAWDHTEVHLWFHSYELTRFDEWGYLEEFLRDSSS